MQNAKIKMIYKNISQNIEEEDDRRIARGEDRSYRVESDPLFHFNVSEDSLDIFTPFSSEDGEHENMSDSMSSRPTTMRTLIVSVKI